MHTRTNFAAQLDRNSDLQAMALVSRQLGTAATIALYQCVVLDLEDSARKWSMVATSQHLRHIHEINIVSKQPSLDSMLDIDRWRYHAPIPLYELLKALPDGVLKRLK